MLRTATRLASPTGSVLVSAMEHIERPTIGLLNVGTEEIKGNELHAVVLSHGHTDHTRGLMGFIKRYGRPGAAASTAGASAMNIVTAATALGYGANWLTGWFAFDRDVLDGLGLKADEKLAGFIHIGTPSKPSEDRPRPALSAFTVP